MMGRIRLSYLRFVAHNKTNGAARSVAFASGDTDPHGSHPMARKSTTGGGTATIDPPKRAKAGTKPANTTTRAKAQPANMEAATARTTRGKGIASSTTAAKPAATSRPPKAKAATRGR
jgi:hypothetical protein